MKKYLLNAPQQPYVKIIDSLFAEMVLDKAIREFRIEQIHKEIDQSLQNRNKDEFLQLTEELKQLSLN
ncbi:IDEAL domain-containing protein [Peribacillus cavernae]|uniref:IDEAL domain-containing protein n=1 Tax=Peribacillus cavernae TaxID=1674310 RepID=A0A3S0UIX9_9BACI|nr:IDEAL domain-containing protein [Peribacillus cavernae]MDQ0218182.1 uncharacterized protein YpiB (UPF0302 family) [Peribacillus cavernae]RUQ32673.1 IDEAL domain-containing protein [Peribacillus cavernae]